MQKKRKNCRRQYTIRTIVEKWQHHDPLSTRQKFQPNLQFATLRVSRDRYSMVFCKPDHITPPPINHGFRNWTNWGKPDAVSHDMPRFSPLPFPLCLPQRRHKFLFPRPSQKSAPVRTGPLGGHP